MVDDTLKQTWEIIDNKYIFFMNIGQKENVSKQWDGRQCHNCYNLK